MTTLTITVHVTQQHIYRGEVNCGRCPIALALSDLGLHNVFVTCLRAYFETRTGERMSADLPEPAKDLVQAFDNRQPVGPISFQITPEPLPFLSNREHYGSTATTQL
jgi:hypothetical protein